MQRSLRDDRHRTINDVTNYGHVYRICSKQLNHYFYYFYIGSLLFQHTPVNEFSVKSWVNFGAQRWSH